MISTKQRYFSRTETKRPTRTTYIYHILDSRGRVRYVGLAMNPDSRLKGHIMEAKQRFADRMVPRPFIRWLMSQLVEGKSVRVKTIRVAGATYQQQIEAERKEIYKQMKAGQPITNASLKGAHYRTRNGWICDVCGERVTVGHSCVCDQTLRERWAAMNAGGAE